MELGANSVELVFHVNGRSWDRSLTATGCWREACPDCLCRRLRTGKHTFDRTEQLEFSSLQFAFECERRCFSNVSKKHIRFLDVIQGGTKTRGDGFFHQTFAQTDAKIARQNLDQVLTFVCRDFCETGFEKFDLGQRTSGLVQGFEKLS